MNWRNVLTKQQKKRLTEKVVEALEKLLSSPARKDLIEPVELGEYEKGNLHGTLTLDKDGLWDNEGCYSSGSGDFGSDHYCPDELIKVRKRDLREIAERFKLVPEKLKKVKISIER